MEDRHGVLAACLDKLRSSKATDRSAATDHLREIFSRPSAWRALEKQRTGHLDVLQAIFASVVAARNAYLRGTNDRTKDAERKRLASSASVLRWFVGQCVDGLQKKTLKAVWAHLLQMLVANRKIFAPVALEYLRTLNLLLAHDPHLQHMDEATWTRAVGVCFCGMAGQPVIDLADMIDSSSNAKDRDDSDIAMSDRETDAHPRADASSSSARQMPSHVRARNVSSGNAANTLESIEYMTCVDHLFRSQLAPLLTYGSILLKFFASFFQLHPTESSAHLPAICALNRLFDSAWLNSQTLMYEATVTLWSPLITFWNSKHLLVREQVALACRRLLLILTLPLAGQTPIENREALIRSLYDRIVPTDSTELRWRTEPLLLESILLAPPPLDRHAPYATASFGAGQGFDPIQAVSWVSLQVSADILASLSKMRSQALSSDTHALESAVRAGKRPRLETPVSSLCNDVRNTSIPISDRLLRLQILVVFAVRHGAHLSDELKQTLLEDLLQLSNNPFDHAIQSWALVGLAALASQCQQPRIEWWSGVWTSSCRRISDRATGRAAAHLCSNLMDIGLPQTLLVTGIEAAFSDLDVRGPAFPSDAIVRWFATCLVCAENSQRLAERSLPDKISAWLANVWTPFGQTVSSGSILGKRSRSDFVSSSALLSLLSKACSLPWRYWGSDRFLLPACPTTNCLLADEKVSPISDLFYLHKVSSRSVLTRGTSISEPAIMLERPATSNERRLLAGLQRTLDSQVDLHESHEHWFELTACQLRERAELASVLLCFAGSLEQARIKVDPSVIRSACRALALVLRLANQTKWLPRERAELYLAFSPLLVTTSLSSDPLYEVCVRVGPGSGVSSQPDPEPGPKLRNEEREAVLQRLWAHKDVRAVMTSMSTGLASLMEPLAMSRQQELDDFDGPTIAVNRTIIDSLLMPGAEHALQACISILVQIDLTRDLLASQRPGAATLSRAVAICVKLSDVRALDIGNEILDALQCGLAGLTEAEWQVLLEHLANDMITSYALARSEKCQLLLLRLLEHSSQIWAADLSAQSTLVSCAREAYIWFQNNCVHQKIYSWRIRLGLVLVIDSFDHIKELNTLWDSYDTQDQVILPSTTLSRMLEDPDSRVSFRVNTACCRHLEYARARGGEVTKILFDHCAQLGPIHAPVEGAALRCVYLCQAMIISQRSRRYAYDLLIEVAARAPALQDILVALSQALSDRLGFPTISALYLHYAGPIMSQWIRLKYLDLRIPDRVCGFQNHRDRTAAEIDCVAVPLLVNDMVDALRIKCDALQLHLPSIIRTHLPAVIANKIALATVNTAEGVDPFPAVLREITGLIEQSDSSTMTFEQFTRAYLDQVLVHTVMLLYEETASASPDGPLGSWQQNPQAMQTYADLLSEVRDFSICTKAPPPWFNAECVYSVLVWFVKCYGSGENTAVLYSSVQVLLHHVHQMPFIDDQRRTLFMLAALISLNEPDISSLGLLRILMHYLTHLLARPAISDIVWSMLAWTIERYVRLGHAHDGQQLLGFADLVALAAHYALQLTNCEERMPVAIGSSALQWLEQLVVELFKSSSLELARQSVFAAALWPHECSSIPRIDLEGIEEMLDSAFPWSNLRHLLRALAALDLSPDSEEAVRLGAVTFRVLRGCKDGSAMTKADAESLTALVSIAETHFCTGTLLNSCAQRVHPPYAAPLLGNETTQAICVGLLGQCLLSSDLLLVNTAVAALRRVFVTVALDTRKASAEDIHGVGFDLLELARDSLKRSWELASTVSRGPGLEALITESWITKARDANEWIANLSVLVGQQASTVAPMYAQLQPCLLHDTAFARSSLPILVTVLLQSKENSTQARMYLSEHFVRVIASPCSDIESLAVIIDIVLHLRKTDLPGKRKREDGIKLLLPFIELAKAAIRCHLASAALLFLELAQDHDEDKAACGLQAPQVRTLMCSVSEQIGEPDGFYGIAPGEIQETLASRYAHEGAWSKAFQLHSSLFEARSGTSTADLDLLPVGNSLKSWGFKHLASQVGALRRAGDLADLDLAWRTDHWDIPVEQTTTTSARIYRALRDAHCSANRALAIDRASNGLVEELRSILHILQRSDHIAGSKLAALITLSDITRWQQAQHARSVDESKAEITDMNRLPTTIFEVNEPVVAARLSLLQAERNAEMLNQIGDALTPVARDNAIRAQQLCLALSRDARMNGQQQLALNMVNVAQSLGSLVDTDDDGAKVELSHTLWELGEHGLARDIVSRLISRSQGCTKADLLATMGGWTAAARLMPPSEIADRYFAPAVALARSSKLSDDRLGEVVYQFASYAVQQYKQLAKEDLAMKRLSVLRAQKQHEIKALDAQLRHSSTQSAERHRLQTSKDDATKVIRQDRDRLEKFEAARSSFLKHAIIMLLQTLACTDQHPDAISRLISIWMEHQQDDEVNRLVQQHLNSVPSAKFVPLSHQISARVARFTGSTLCRQILSGLVERMALDHPFHVVYQLLSLRKASDSAFPENNLASTQAPRADAAGEIIERIKRAPALRPKVAALEALCEAYIEWASFDLDRLPDYKRSKKDSTLKMPQIKLLRLRSQTHAIPVSTVALPMDPTCRYDADSLPCIYQYESTFKIVGGVNRPKLSICIDSMGGTHKQLFKPGDDVRQDAVMEQVFEVANGLLRRDKATFKRNLRVRTYRVIPLTADTGLLEFAKDTMPIMAWLPEAHARYHPKDARYETARQKFAEARQDFEAQRAVWKELYAGRWHPVLRHFFREEQKEPSLWHEMRLNYGRSLATNSIIGDLLGIGDRHCSNILIDSVRGELVHIDFGIVFEAGTRLPIPETVPFRLTPDMIDGLGMTGVEGVFRRCSEETLRVMRRGAVDVMTILEVFKYDPLQKWTLSAGKIRKAQGTQLSEADAQDLADGSGDVPTDAHRAIDQVSAKLNSTLSVEYQVNDLIQQAQNPDNLCRIFCGWAPWM
ncbi:hypothetical protein E5Q_04568 [Mixia osmundae IAM 14324]|uniref:Serine/threonine-protein kinase TEL1 n=1 Tax=Mixia osmundae (strain CBS 9802 / IAM 14324 / JCM 22182 / KY 12970) TaxID=764103 RepID=G7E4X8_MIXOS|nr:hypothetical protein E5Q_04568 [Mixia osmundae IAM 14324]